MLTIIGFILVIAVVVFIHEYGHYYVAKSFGVKIEEFSIGFGKEIYSRFDKNGVKWRIAAIPLGGFVKMYGDTDASSVESTKVKDLTKAFYTQPWYARFLIIAADPIANYLLAIFILAIFYFSFGKVEIPAIVGEVMQESPAEHSGIKPGDRILKADNSNITDFANLHRIILINQGRPIKLLINRNSEIIELTVIPSEKIWDQNEPLKKVGYIGIASKEQAKRVTVSVVGSLYLALVDTVEISSLTLKAVGQMLNGNRAFSDIHGPITIAKESGKTLSDGPLEFILFIAMMSINLDLVNLLPIPILDGGHLAMIIYEVVAKKPLSKYAQATLLKMGMLIIFFLIVISLSNDIKSLIF